MKRNKKFFFICIYLIIIFMLINNGIYYNPSKSMKVGYYIREFNTTLNNGDIVLICVIDIRQQKKMFELGLPHAKTQCSNGVPYLLKKIFAKENDLLQVNRLGIWVNRDLIPNTKILGSYKSHRLYSMLPMGLYRLKKGEFIVLGLSTHSYDSRYFGVIKRSQIYSKVRFIF